jgi:hypothetical protein
MGQWIIQFGPPQAEGPCTLCGARTNTGTGPQLYRAEDDRPVCPDCGRAHAPTLRALLELAHVAERVGRISRHSPWVPLDKLLELARAAEDYLATSPERKSA